MENNMNKDVGEKRLMDFNSEYIEIIGNANFLGNKISFRVDYGDGVAVCLKDGKDKEVKLKSMVDGMNLFAEYGYEFASSYTVVVENKNVYHYLLRKSKQSLFKQF